MSLSNQFSRVDLRCGPIKNSVLHINKISCQIDNVFLSSSIKLDEICWQTPVGKLICMEVGIYV